MTGERIQPRVVKAVHVLMVLGVLAMLVATRHIVFETLVILLFVLIASGIARFIFRKSTELRRAKASMVASALVLVVVSILLFADHRPIQLFRDYVKAPVPESVEVFDGEYVSGLDPAIMLHFRIAPKDLDQLISEKSLKLKGVFRTTCPADDPEAALENLAADPKTSIGRGAKVSWWHPENLRQPARYTGGDMQSNTIEMWVNEERTEVFYFFGFL